MKSKDVPKLLEKIILYSDIGMGGKCPTCGGLNKIMNDKCNECGQRFIKGGAVHNG